MKDLKYYQNLPYTIIFRKDEDGDYVGRVEELAGCSAHGKTLKEAIDSLEEAKELWIADCIESKSTVPVPAVELLPSGKWLQRVPRSLHRKLIDMAKKEGVSLNQFVTSVLSEAIGKKNNQIDIAASHEGHGESLWAKVQECAFYNADDWQIQVRGNPRLSGISHLFPLIQAKHTKWEFAE